MTGDEGERIICDFPLGLFGVFFLGTSFFFSAGRLRAFCCCRVIVKEKATEY